MAQQHYKTLFKKALLQFIMESDPLLAVLKWVMAEMMRIKAEAKVGAGKGKHSQEHTTYLSGARIRRVDTRLGMVHLLVPKVRKGCYVPFLGRFWPSSPCSTNRRTPGASSSAS